METMKINKIKNEERKKTQRNTLVKLIPSLQKPQLSEKSLKNDFQFKDHPGAQYIRGTRPTKTEFRKFITLFYRGLSYAVMNLKGPSDQFIKKKSLSLPESENKKKKFLFLDLDETLIHSVMKTQKADVCFNTKGEDFRFNIRPYCFEFLQHMSKYYNVYVFTASTIDYAEPIVSYLNEKKKVIQCVLNRRNCMETHNGFYIKDLRIIKNRTLKDIVLVDNLVHSFGLQLENGIPILQYSKGKEDRELIQLEKILIEMADVEDVRKYLGQKLGLKKILQIKEEDFICFDEDSMKKGKLTRS